jgi:hypothetical protein
MKRTRYLARMDTGPLQRPPAMVPPSWLPNGAYPINCVDCEIAGRIEEQRCEVCPGWQVFGRSEPKRRLLDRLLRRNR